MLSNGDDIRTRHLNQLSIWSAYNCNSYLEDLNSVFDSSIEINVVGTNSGSDAQLEVLGLKIIGIRDCYPWMSPDDNLPCRRGHASSSYIAWMNKFNKYRRKAYPGWNGVVMSTSA